MSTSSSISRRYATAFVDAAEAAGTVDTVAGELERFAGAFEAAPDLPNVLTNPVFTSAERTKTLASVITALQVSDMSKRILDMLLEGDRMAEVPGSARAVRTLADQRSSRVRATIESAAELSAETIGNLKRALEKRTGKVVELDVAVDPGLLGGIRTTIGSTVLDGPIRRQLDELREDLLRAD